MQGSQEITSSQECPLPLSQENFSEFYSSSLEFLNNDDVLAEIENEVQGPNPNTMPDIESNGTSVEPDLIPTNLPSPCPLASNNWPGAYNFGIFFNAVENTKKPTWSYSQERDKLYVIRDGPCCINFFTEQAPPEGSVIRATVVYSQPQHANENVRRCFNHIFQNDCKDIDGYLIGCDSPQVLYDSNLSTGHLSVVVPYGMPQCGEHYTTHVFRFFCFNSCLKRPIKVIFSLENGSVQIGRRSLNVKVCACPARDCKNDDEKQSKGRPEENETPCRRVSTKKKRKRSSQEASKASKRKPVKQEFSLLNKDEISSAVCDTPSGFPAVVDMVSAAHILPPNQTSNSFFNNFPGEYGFDIDFENEKSRGPSFIYSPEMDKLYVTMDSPCPIAFTTNKPVPPDIRIRICAVFSQPECAAQLVKRCLFHVQADLNKGLDGAYHLISCESSCAYYDTDKRTGCLSVIVPFQNPIVGQNSSVYILKFKCLSSCKGLDRKPIRVVFRLEKGIDVIGQRSFAVKVCSCPVRDCRNDQEQKYGTSSKKKSEPHQNIATTSRDSGLSSHFMNMFHFVSELSHSKPKLPKAAKTKKKKYILTGSDPNECEFLKQILATFSLFRTVDTLRGMQRPLRMKEESDSSDGSD